MREARLAAGYFRHTSVRRFDKLIEIVNEGEWKLQCHSLLHRNSIPPTFFSEFRAFLSAQMKSEVC
jgi:hypothetical protein